MATPEVVGATQSKGSLPDDPPNKIIPMSTASSGDDTVIGILGGAEGNSFELGKNSLLADDTDNDSNDEGGMEEASNSHKDDLGLNQ